MLHGHNPCPISKIMTQKACNHY